MCGASVRKQSCSAIHGRRSAHALTDDIACTDRERGDPDYGADPVHRQQRSEREHTKRKHLHGNLLVNTVTVWTPWCIAMRLPACAFRLKWPDFSIFRE